ncbi:MAG: hypothetical protein ACO2PL_11665 [Armatimonadota bacterium]
MKSMHPMSLPLLAIGYSLPQKERGSSRNHALRSTHYRLPFVLQTL